MLRGGVRRAALLLTALAVGSFFGATRARAAPPDGAGEEIAIIDRSGNPRWLDVVAKSVATLLPGAVIISAEDARQLARSWTADCGPTDAACFSRAGVAGALTGLILVDDGAVTWVDVEAVTLARRAATAVDVTAVIDALRHPEWAAPVVVAVPTPTTTPTTTTPTTTTPTTTTPTTTTPTTTTPTTTTPTTTTPPWPAALVTTGAGAGVAVLGVATGLIAEMLALQAIADIKAGRQADLGTIEAVEIGAFVVAGVGAAVAVGGVVLGLLGTEAAAAETAAIPPQ